MENGISDPEDSFETASNNFIEWFLAHPEASVNPKISLADLRGQGEGRGVVALAPIAEDELLFSIPHTLILSVENSCLQATAPHLLTNLDPWLSLILVLIHESLHPRTSAWTPYISLFPTHFDTLMFWTSSELSHLQGSAITSKIGREKADLTFTTQLIPLIHAHPSLFPVSADTDLLALAHRMASTILAYAFDISSSPTPSPTSSPSSHSSRLESDSGSSDADATLAKGLIPLADLLNANASLVNARLFHSSSPIALTMRATTPIPAKAQIYNDYGPLPPGDLLRRYGYTTSLYDPYSILEVPTALILSTLSLASDPAQLALQVEKIAFLDSHGVWDEDGYDICYPSPSAPGSGFSEELLVVLKTLVMREEEFRALVERDRLPRASLAVGVRRVLRSVLQGVGKGYDATTVEEDEEILRSMEQEDGGEEEKEDGRRRLRYAVLVRLGEKRILRRAIAEMGSEADDEKVGMKRKGDDSQDHGDEKSKRVR